jgi:hypothetical protein
MRAALLLTALAAFALVAGPAAASDYMLPSLLEGEPPFAPAPAEAPPQEPQSIPAPAPSSGIAMGVALAAAALVVVGGFWWARSDRLA